MKLNKSQKNITIITDRKAQHESLMIRSQGRGPLSNMSRAHLSPYQQTRAPSATKNKTELAEYSNSQNNCVSASKGKKSRSSSIKSIKENVTVQQNRKKQLDFLCFQRMLNQIKKYLVERSEMWDFNHLCYKQLIKIFWLFRFVPYPNEQQFIRNNLQGELKKIYCLWLSLSTKKLINFRLIMSFVQIIENINVERDRQEQVIFLFISQLRANELRVYEHFEIDPQYTFFMKKMDLKRTDDQLLLDEVSKEKLLTYFNSFKLSKLKDSSFLQCIKIEQSHSLVSKKSTELADKKRRKIQEKIKKNNPHIENINLLDILSFRERDHVQVTKKPMEMRKKKKNENAKKAQFKKEIQYLSKPKMYFDERREDEVHFERDQQQFTFHPKINPYKGDGKQKIMQIKNVDKVLVRMKEARQLKEQKKYIIQKGWNNNNARINEHFNNRNTKLLSDPNKQNDDEESAQVTDLKNQEKYEEIQTTEDKPRKYQVSKDYLRIPILYIDVNIEEGKKQRIIIYDNDKAADLAREFGQKHKLQQETINRLQILLEQQMETVLARIEQETQDECSIIQ